jgi:hypothetical protein
MSRTETTHYGLRDLRTGRMARYSSTSGDEGVPDSYALSLDSDDPRWEVSNFLDLVRVMNGKQSGYGYDREQPGWGWGKLKPEAFEVVAFDRLLVHEGDPKTSDPVEETMTVRQVPFLGVVDVRNFTGGRRLPKSAYRGYFGLEVKDEDIETLRMALVAVDKAAVDGMVGMYAVGGTTGPILASVEVPEEYPIDIGKPHLNEGETMRLVIIDVRIVPGPSIELEPVLAPSPIF